MEAIDGPTVREVTVGLRVAETEFVAGRVAIGGADEGSSSVPVPPRLTLSLSEGLTISGAVGSKYRIEYAEQLNGQTEWKELRTLILKTPESATRVDPNRFTFVLNFFQELRRINRGR